VSYSLFILPRAKRELADLPTEHFNAAELKISALRDQPRPAGCKKLAKRKGWRIRFGNYRILYKIDDTNRIITIDSVGHRKDVYR
jgi:mRNA interferase RelE/StbE